MLATTVSRFQSRRAQPARSQRSLLAASLQLASSLEAQLLHTVDGWAAGQGRAVLAGWLTAESRKLTFLMMHMLGYEEAHIDCMHTYVRIHGKVMYAHGRAYICMWEHIVMYILANCISMARCVY